MKLLSLWRGFFAGAVLLSLLALSAGCGGDTSTGIRVVSVKDAAAILENPPADLVVLDVRTPAEFAGGRLPGAVMIDFYEPNFADQLAGLDPELPYLLYCRSGNRSGSTRQIMQDLGFTDVADIDGGIAAWLNAGQPFVR